MCHVPHGSNRPSLNPAGQEMVVRLDTAQVNLGLFPFSLARNGDRPSYVQNIARPGTSNTPGTTWAWNIFRTGTKTKQTNEALVVLSFAA
jgi:hypothetical protein